VGLFGSTPDPTQVLIAELRSERDHYKARVTELEKQVIALADRAAYRVLHPEPRTPGPGLPADAFASRHTTLRPEFTLQTIDAQIKGDA